MRDVGVIAKKKNDRAFKGAGAQFLHREQSASAFSGALLIGVVAVSQAHTSVLSKECSSSSQWGVSSGSFCALIASPG